MAQRHGLRAMLTDALLTAAAAEGGLDSAEQREALAALVSRVRSHPALYAYHLRDEPGAGLFPQLGKAVAFLREHDPGRLAYINLFPTYATNEQLGTAGDTATAYREHLRRFVAEVRRRLVQEVRSIAAGIESTYLAAKAREDELRAQLGAQKAAALRLEDAAVEYAIALLRERPGTTQANVARRYGIAATSLGTRYGEIRDALSLVPNDPRYA